MERCLCFKDSLFSLTLLSTMYVYVCASISVNMIVYTCVLMLMHLFTQLPVCKFTRFGGYYRIHLLKHPTMTVSEINDRALCDVTFYPLAPLTPSSSSISFSLSLSLSLSLSSPSLPGTEFCNEGRSSSSRVLLCETSSTLRLD